MVDFQDPVVIIDEYRAFAPRPSSTVSKAHWNYLVTEAFVKLCHALGGLYM